MTTTIEQQQTLSIKNACVEFMFAYQQKNIDKMMSLCDPEGTVYFTPLGDSGKGKIGELGKAIWTTIIHCFPDVDNTLDAAVADDVNTVRCQVMIRGTQAKDFAGITSKGKHFDSEHIFIFRFDNGGKISNINISWDHDSFVQQLTK